MPTGLHKLGTNYSREHGRQEPVSEEQTARGGGARQIRQSQWVVDNLPGLEQAQQEPAEGRTPLLEQEGPLCRAAAPPEGARCLLPVSWAAPSAPRTDQASGLLLVLPFVRNLERLFQATVCSAP